MSVGFRSSTATYIIRNLITPAYLMTLVYGSGVHGVRCSKGGEQALQNAEALLAAWHRGDPAGPKLSLTQIKEQWQLAVNRVMAEGSLYAPELAALAIKLAWGDQVEAAFLLRVYRIKGEHSRLSNL